VSPRAPRDELAETTAVGEIYLRRLVRAQLGLSLTALLSFGGVFAGLPLALWLAPGVDDVELLGVPLTLLVLCVGVFPLLVAVGLLYARRANALDEEFRELVDGTDQR
jgi:putative solute:sodium symporter small subunit